MKTLPQPDPGTADVRSPVRYLVALARKQVWSLAGGSLFGIIWMVAQAVMPAIIGRGVDEGVTGRDGRALLFWGGLLLLAGVTQAVAGVFRHRYAVTNFLIAAYRTMQLVVRQTTRLGATMPRRVAMGEVVSVGNTDIEHVGDSLEITGRFAGAVVSFVVVAVLLLRASTTLGLVVLVGVPVLMLAVVPVIRPFQRRQADQRERTGRLNTLAGDIVAGLRVIRGVGGEQTFASRYQQQSQEVRSRGVHVAKVQSVIDGMQILLPGVFIVFVTWLGAHFALAGRISAGDLVAFYGYSAFLMFPLMTVTEAVNKWTRGVVAARRVIAILRLEPEIVEAASPVPAPAPGAVLVDGESGLAVDPGRLTVVASADPADGVAVADRLGRYVDADVRWGDVSLASVALADVRRRIVVSHLESQLFSGRLGDELDITGEAGEPRVLDAVGVASATDVLDAAPGGLDAQVDERGRSFSGGERQRLVLSRALLADPEVLVLVEPTSAVDAHTEVRIAAGLRDAREGRTTVVISTSPLLLDRADRVAFVDGGRLVAQGTHDDLLETSPRYRAVVTREDN